MSCRALSLAALVLAACGGGGTTSPPNPPPPPPPPAGPPASLSIQAGDGQQAEPLVTLPIRPAVLVRDAAGQPVAGATVSFAVDSGGGTITAASAVSGAAGVATAGDWKLGPAEGRNTLLASVAGLPPARLAATAAIHGATLPPGSIPAAGGSYVVTQAGPLSGFRIDVPAGAFAGVLPLAVSYGSNLGIPRIAAVNPVSPLIQISTTQTGLAAGLVKIHIPATIPAGTFPLVMLYDAATGTMETLPTISWDAAGVTAATTHLDAGNMLHPGAAALRAGGIAHAQSPGIGTFVSAIPMATLMQDYSTGFLPGNDDWEVFGHPTPLAPGGSVAGATVSMLWYFAAHPGSLKLNGKFSLAPGVPRSNRTVMRWGSELTGPFDLTATPLIQAALRTATGSQAAFDQNQFLSIRGAFASAVVPQPQLVLMADPAGIQWPVLAYGAIGNQILIADNTVPGDLSLRLTFPAAAVMTPYTNSFRQGNGLSTATEAMMVPLGAIIPLPLLNSTWQQVLAKTIGDADFPVATLNSWSGPLYDTLFVVDTLRMWLECATCKTGYATILNPPPSGKIATSLGIYSLSAGTWSLFSTGGWNTRGLLLNPASTDLVSGLPVAIPRVDGVQAASGAPAQWLDWHMFTVRRLPASISPAPLSQAPQVPLTLKFETTPSLLPAHVTYRWDFGDGQPKSLVNDDPNVQHTWNAAGQYPVVAEIVDVRNSQVIARATATANIEARFVWQFQSITAVTTNFPPGGIGTDPHDLQIQTFVTGSLASLQQSPGNSLLYIASGAGGCLWGFLEQFPPGQVDITQVVPSAFRDIFGSNCNDPDYIATLTMGTLGSGTLVGSAAESNANPDVLVTPGGFINATMSGKSLQGSYGWKVRYSTGIATYAFNFVATQVVP